VPTEKGLSVYEIVKDKRIADVALTGDWENTLSQIERGKMLPETFQKVIKIYTRQITEELLQTAITHSKFPSTGGGRGWSGGGQGGALSLSKCEAVCPKCKTGAIRIYPKVAKCTDANCGLAVFRTVSEKQLSDKQITDLLTNGKTSVIKGFKSKAGKTFDAALKFDENYRTVFVFTEKQQKKGKK
jgi:DNA topoisomerase-3